MEGLLSTVPTPSSLDLIKLQVVSCKLKVVSCSPVNSQVAKRLEEGQELPVTLQPWKEQQKVLHPDDSSLGLENQMVDLFVF